MKDKASNKDDIVFKDDKVVLTNVNVYVCLEDK